MNLRQVQLRLAEMIECAKCHGCGNLFMPGEIVECSQCEGTGQIYPPVCLGCEGSGYAVTFNSVCIYINHGIDTNVESYTRCPYCNGSGFSGT